MPQALVIVAHPEPKSFTVALARAAVNALESGGWGVMRTDLYAERFDPVSDRRNFLGEPLSNTVFQQQDEERYASAHDLFSPALVAEQEKLLRADLIIWQFPLWWGGMPAIMKGWMDRVLASGFAYGGGKSFETGLLRGKCGLLSLTTGGAEHRFFPNGFGTIETVLHPIQRCIIEFTGLKALAPNIVYQPKQKSLAERERALSDWRMRLASISTEMRSAA